jgi:hypothetical protein
MNDTIKVEGLKDLEKALVALQKEYGGKAAPQAMRPAVVAAVKPLKPRVQDSTPVDDGWLLKSVKQKVGKPIIAGRVGYFGNNVYKRAVHQEFGTMNLPAKRMLEKAFDAEAKGMVARFSKTLGPAIEKKAKALNKKRGSK